MKGDRIMTNREKLTKTDIYDLLCRMQHNLSTIDLSGLCVLEEVTGRRCACPPIPSKPDKCNRCISLWLGEEARP